MRKAGAAVFLLALIIGLASLGNQFVYDDVPAIVENRILHSLGNSPLFWTSSYWPSGLLYRPLTIQLFALEWWVGGGAPGPFHAVNALLYAIVAVLVFRTARHLLPEPRVAAPAAGLIFAVHPVHVEVVANAVGQSELLAAFLVLLGVERYVAWRRRGPLGPWQRGALALLYLLAIGAKETGYVLPVLIAAVELLAVGREQPWRERLRVAGPVLAILAGAGLAALLVRGILFLDLRGEVAQLPLRGYGLLERAVIMLAAVPEWGRLLLWPAHLQAHYGPPELAVTTRLTLAHLTGLALLALALIGLAASHRRAPVVSLGIVWIVIALAPVSNILAATGVLVAERTLFLPSVGMALGFGGLVAALAARAGRTRTLAWGLGSGFLVLIGAGLVRSLERVRVWHDQDEFFARLERDAPGSYRARLAAGTYYLGARRLPEAERALRAAWLLFRDDPTVPETYGQLFRIQKRCDLALPIFADGVARHPEATTVRARYIECALALGDTAAARRAAEDAIRMGLGEFRGPLKRVMESGARAAPRP